MSADPKVTRFRIFDLVLKFFVVCKLETVPSTPPVLTAHAVCSVYLLSVPTAAALGLLIAGALWLLLVLVFRPYQFDVCRAFSSLTCFLLVGEYLDK